MMIPKPLDTILIAVAISAVLVSDTNAFATNNKKLVHDINVRNSHRCSKFVPTLCFIDMLLFGYYMFGVSYVVGVV